MSYLLHWSPKFFNNVYSFADLTTLGTFTKKNCVNKKVENQPALTYISNDDAQNYPFCKL